MEEGQESVSKTEEQVEAKDEAMVDGEDKGEASVEHRDDVGEKPVTTDNVDSTDAVKSTSAVEHPSTGDDGEKMQTDESPAA